MICAALIATALAAEPVETHIDGDPALFVRSAGKGKRTLVVIHGGPGTTHNHLEVMERLDGVRVVTWDQRGVGASEAPSDDDAWRLEDYIADVERVRVWTGSETIDVLGHSWGGIVAMAYATQHPNRLRSLVLVGSSGVTRDGNSRAGVAMGKRRQQLMDSGAMPDSPPEGLDPSCIDWWKTLATYYEDPRTFRADDLPGSCHPDVLSKTWRAVGQYDLRVGLAGLTAPTLLVFGSADPLRVNADTLTAALPTVTSPTWIEGCGHRPMHECPGAFFPLLDRFYQ